MTGREETSLQAMREEPFIFELHGDEVPAHEARCFFYDGSLVDADELAEAFKFWLLDLYAKADIHAVYEIRTNIDEAR